jgi:hypothetical protein
MPDKPRAAGWRDILPPGAAIVWAIAAIAISILVWFKPNSRTVYPIYAQAGQVWLQGGDVYTPGSGGVKLDGYRYSPLVAIGFAGLSQLPDPIGGILWRWLGIAALMGGFAYACRVLDATWPAKTVRERQGLWLLLAPLCVANLNNGQANIHVAGLLLLGVAAVGNSRWNVAAVCLALACFVKVYPVSLALLLIALYPLQLGPRFALALAIGLGLPFLSQPSEYVLHEYGMWVKVMVGDDRFAAATGTSYRDFAQLLYLALIPIGRTQFLALQIATGVVAALACLLARRQFGGDARRLLRFTFSLGVFWMLLFGPATESSTYILLSPVAAWLTVDAFRDEFGTGAKWLIVTGFALVHFALASSAFPIYRTVHSLGLHPLGALVMLAGYVWAEAGQGIARACSESAAMAPIESIAPRRRSA